MNYRRLFVIAIILNIALAFAAYWMWKSSRPAMVAAKPQSEHPPMEGFASSAPAEDAAPELTPIELTPERMQTIGVRTGQVEYKNIASDIRATGSVEVDERRVAYVQTRYPGWIKQVFVSSTYQHVEKGQPLFTIYSPELVASEQEYLLAKANAQRVNQSPVEGVASGANTLLSAARERLLQWNLSESDVARLDTSNKPQTEFTFSSPVSGYVTDRSALPNVYAQPDMRLYTIADLSSVWVEAQVFQEDAGRLKPNDAADITVDAYPNRTFRARVEQVLPQVDATTRTLRVRLHVANSNLLLKPGMFVNVVLHAPMGRQLFVPATAVLQSGSKWVVFLARGNGRFDPREVELGTRTDDGFSVVKGLQAGERVATSANFLIDSESQLQAATGSYTPASTGAATEISAASQISAELNTFPAPAHKGHNSVHVKLTSAGGAPLAGAKVNVQFFMPAMPQMGMSEMKASIQLNETGNGSYAGDVELGSGGTWQLTVIAEQGGKLILTQRMNLSVIGGM